MQYTSEPSPDLLTPNPRSKFLQFVTLQCIKIFLFGVFDTFRYHHSSRLSLKTLKDLPSFFYPNLLDSLFLGSIHTKRVSLGTSSKFNSAISVSPPYLVPVGH